MNRYKSHINPQPESGRIEATASLGMVLNWPFAFDSLLPLPAAGLGDFVEGCALHTSRRTATAPRGGVGGFRGGLRPPHLPKTC